MGSSGLQFELKMSTHSRAGLVCVLVGLATARFCPRESRDGFECRAKEDQFKCGIFFNNLLGKNEIKWIGAMPDAIKTARRKDASLVEKIFPKVNGKAVTEPYFKSWANKCDAEEANDKCYLLFDQRKGDALDSCEETIGNLDGKDTIGNQLCDQAKRFLKADGQSRQGVKDVLISFYSSTCKNSWEAVKSSAAGTLHAVNKLCCDADWKYYSCDGRPFVKEC